MSHFSDSQFVDTISLVSRAHLPLVLELYSIPFNRGFTINPYDQCVANKQINGKQCTIVWHVDYLKISHVSKDVAEDIIVRLNKKFGKESPLTTNRGKILEYLGLTMDYSEKGRVRISMYEYVKKSSMSHLPRRRQAVTCFILTQNVGSYQKRRRNYFITSQPSFCTYVRGQGKIYKQQWLFYARE